jgi:carbon monoxide dehydrogenase subunit G
MMPGIAGVVAQEDGSYAATMTVKLGPVSLNLQGKIRMELQDRANYHAVMRLEGADRRVGGSATATMDVQLTSPEEGVTQLSITTDANLLGRLGQVGLPLIKHKADATVAEFVRSLAREA